MVFFFKARQKELSEGNTNVDDRRLTQLNNMMSLTQIKEQVESLETLLNLFDNKELNEILLMLEDIRNRQKMVSLFEKFFFVIDNNKRKIREAKSQVEVLESENSKKEAENRKLKRRMIELKNEVVTLLQDNFKAKFIINLPSLK